MRRIVTMVIALIPLCAVPGFADVNGSDFDGMNTGPYVGAGTILEGPPGNVMVSQVSDGTMHEAPLPPHASGNMLCIDAVGKAVRIVMEFSFDCAINPGGVCQVEYDYSVAQWYGDGVEVFIDPMGDYSDPADKIDIPIGIPPSAAHGHNTETKGACDASKHTVTFVVQPGSILYIDNLGTTCLLPTPARGPSWGQLKIIYRSPGKVG